MSRRILLLIATLLLLHAAFSAYEHQSFVKASGRSKSSLPQDIVFECIISLVLGILGASLNAPDLKEITWCSEMKKRKIDEMDARTGFASYSHRGGRLFGINEK